MKHNVILIVLDGLNYEVARHAMGIFKLGTLQDGPRSTRWNANCPPSPVPFTNAY